MGGGGWGDKHILPPDMVIYFFIMKIGKLGDRPVFLEFVADFNETSNIN